MRFYNSLITKCYLTNLSDPKVIWIKDPCLDESALPRAIKQNYDYHSVKVLLHDPDMLMIDFKQIHEEVWNGDNDLNTMLYKCNGRRIKKQCAREDGLSLSHHSWKEFSQYGFLLCLCGTNPSLLHTLWGVGTMWLGNDWTEWGLGQGISHMIFTIVLQTFPSKVGCYIHVKWGWGTTFQLISD